ncbi:GAF domain-containing protein [Sphingomonas flavescens]|uniref:GAF domain-containing protein n=1 Tax=Sphingomonas flavescens TaxID=3132797 RepID=UPI002805A7FF|nr:GAF domain-containing protein [Sphingomonas limnosediminicola]
MGLLYDAGMLEQHAQYAGEVERLGSMFAHAPGFMALVGGKDLRFLVANEAFKKLVGRSDLAGKAFNEAFPELDDQGIDDILLGVARSGEAFVARAMPMTVVRSDLTPEELVLDLVFQPVPEGIFIQGHDVTDQKRGEMLRVAHSKVLGLAINDSPLEQTLGELIRIVESGSSTGVLGSILLLDADGRHLRYGAAPSLPRAYSEAIDGFEIGPCAGSCGTAAYNGSAVYVSDIANDPLWADYRDLALAHGLRACWSIPILTHGGDVLGTFAMYHREPREPTYRDLLLVDLIIQTAALVIDRDRAKTALRRALSPA